MSQQIDSSSGARDVQDARVVDVAIIGAGAAGMMCALVAGNAAKACC